MDLVDLRLRQSRDLSSFLIELRNLLTQSTAAAPLITATSLRSPTFFRTIKQDLDTIGWDHVTHLANDLTSLTIRCVDAAGRSHNLSLTLLPSFPATAPLATADLPTAFHLRWGPGSTLSDVMMQFEETVGRFQRFWDELEDLDSRAWVIEPSAPSRSATFRRLALEKHVTLAININPLDIGAVPELQFMGSDRVVEPLLTNVRTNRTLWHPQCSLWMNLGTLLGAPLPERQAEGSTAAEDVGAECAICYNYRRPVEGSDNAIIDDVITEQGDVPEVNCDNPACGKPFHRLCLREWLAADPSSLTSFATMFGACPYCTAPIAVKAR